MSESGAGLNLLNLCGIVCTRQQTFQPWFEQHSVWGAGFLNVWAWLGADLWQLIHPRSMECKTIHMLLMPACSGIRHMAYVRHQLDL